MHITKKEIKRNDKLRKQIRTIRKEKGYTQQQLADKLRISLSYMGKFETGARKPNLKMLSGIADALRVKVKDLIDF